MGEHEKLDNQRHNGKVVSRSFDPVNQIQKTIVDRDQLSLAVVGCTGSGEYPQDVVANCLLQHDSELTTIELPGDAEYPDDGVSIDSQAAADAQCERYLVKPFTHKNYSASGRTIKTGSVESTNDELSQQDVNEGQAADSHDISKQALSFQASTTPVNVAIGNHEVQCYGRGPKNFQTALNKANAFVQTINRVGKRPQHLLANGEPKFWMPERYYLEEVYYLDADDKQQPLALKLYLDSSLIAGDDKKQQSWQHDGQQQWLAKLAKCLEDPNNSHYQQFPQRIIIQHHSVYFSPDKRGRSIKEHPKYPHDKQYKGNHHRVVGQVLEACGLQLNQWILAAAHIHTSAIMENDDLSPHLPKTQVVCGAGGSIDNKTDLATMTPGLRRTDADYGFEVINLHANGQFSVKHVKCLDVKRRAPKLEESGRLLYNADGSLQFKYPPSANLNRKLFIKANEDPSLLDKLTDKDPPIIETLNFIIRHQYDMDWRLLAWSIIAQTQWVEEVETDRISPQLFEPLLRVLRDDNQFDDGQLTPELLNVLLRGIEHCFECYLSCDYQGHYAPMFCQLALWHQALAELKRELLYHETRQRSRNSAAASSFFSQYTDLSIQLEPKEFHDWSQGDLRQPYLEEEETDPHDAYDEFKESYPASVRQSPVNMLNKMGPPEDINQKAVKANENQLSQATLAYFVNNEALLVNYLLHACTRLLEVFFDEEYFWNRHRACMDNDEFAQIYIVMGLIAYHKDNPIKALSAFFYEWPHHNLAYHLEWTLLRCCQDDVKHYGDNHDERRVFKHSIQQQITTQHLTEKDCPGGFKQYQGAVLNRLVKNEPPCLRHLMRSKSFFRLKRHPLVLEQIESFLAQTDTSYCEDSQGLQMDDLGSDKRKSQQVVASGFIDQLDTHYSASWSLADWLSPERARPANVYKSYYDTMQTLMSENELHHNQDHDNHFRKENTRNELSMKAFIADKKQQASRFDGRARDWSFTLRRLTEWLFVNHERRDCLDKWQSLQEAWPQEWSNMPPLSNWSRQSSSVISDVTSEDDLSREASANDPYGDAHSMSQ